MRVPAAARQPRHLAAVAAALGLLVGLGGCGLDKAQKPALSGPSETGISVELTAAPDTLNADGVSQSVVQLVLRDENGAAASGRAVLFEHDGDGVLSPSPASTYVGPIQSGIVMATASDGTASVVYTAGNSSRTVTVYVRPYGIDAARAFYRSVEILQR
jgi:hypothetical protein